MMEERCACVAVQVASSAQYIIEQFRATTGCGKLEDGAVKSMYASGRVRLSMLQEPGGGGRAHEGSFVLWQLAPSMWLVEMPVAGQGVAAGSDGRVAWRRTPWLGAHAARGGSRPLRRALQVGIMALPCPAPTGMASLVLHRDAMFLFSSVRPFFAASSLCRSPWACLACTALLLRASLAAQES